MFQLPTVVKRIEKIQCEFLLRDSKDHQKHHLEGWREVRRPTKEGGLKIWSFKKVNLVNTNRESMVYRSLDLTFKI